MTVKELIKVLETCPQDMEVEIRSGYEDYCVSGGAIEHIAQVKSAYSEPHIFLVNESDGDVLRRCDNYTILAWEKETP